MRRNNASRPVELSAAGAGVNRVSIVTENMRREAHARAQPRR